MKLSENNSEVSEDIDPAKTKVEALSAEIADFTSSNYVLRKACSAELCDKKTVFEVRTIYRYYLLKPFTNICNSCRNTILY